MGGEPRLHRAPSAPGALRRSRAPGRVARGSRSGSGRRLGGRAPCCSRGEIVSRGDGASWLAQDERFEGHARECADRTALDVQSGAPRRACVIARSRAASTGPGQLELVEGGASRRVPRLQSERQGSHEKLLGLAAEDEASGLGDAPWPPHFRKMEGEAPRVAPSRARSAVKKPTVKKPRTRAPLLVVANSPDREAAVAGLERWKSKHP